MKIEKQPQKIKFSERPVMTREILLVVVDYYSRFPFVEILKSTTFATITSKLFKIFSVHGLSETLTSDNGGRFHLIKWNHFLQSMVLPTIELYCLGPQAIGQVERINQLS